MAGLTPSLNFHGQALLLRAERQRLIASNIANADTPGYRARELDFKAALAAATGRTAAGELGPAATTHPAHYTGGAVPGEPPELLYARYSQDAVDQNTVDMDRERASFADNSVRYEATLRFINSGVRTMLEAMKSHTQG